MSVITKELDTSGGHTIRVATCSPSCLSLCVCGGGGLGLFAVLETECRTSSF